MWEKLKERKLRFVPRCGSWRSNTRTFRGVFVRADMRYDDLAVVEFWGRYDGDGSDYSHSFYIQVGTPSVAIVKGLMPGLVLTQIKGRKGLAPELLQTIQPKPYMHDTNDWASIVDETTEEVLIGPKK